MVNLGLIYQIGKDIKERLKWKEEIKSVDSEYLGKSGLKAHLEKDGVKLRWSTFDKVPTRKLEGWGIIYEIDETNRTHYQLVRNNEVTLIGKKE